MYFPMGLGDAYDRVLWRQGRDPQVENPCSIRWLLDWIILEILYFVARTEEPCLVFQFPFILPSSWTLYAPISDST